MMNEKIEGDCILNSDEKITGLVVGSLTIPTGVHCELNGTVTSDVIAELGATVAINGTVGGNLISSGAEVDVRGVISGKIIDKSDTMSVRVHSGAVVSGERKP
ncbi:Polymer-forming protein [Marivita hallyeonensis]|uniref:Polymer-forming protein n=2 Tax=Marivita hallyeonensis TaxID=996342 RepID=A0A1M5Y953_9RHOB|nr:Polymer-forming protein [Marivita hallyeonensis]